MRHDVRLGIPKWSRPRLNPILPLLASVTVLGCAAMAQDTKQAQVKSVDDVIALIPKAGARDLDSKSKQDEAARALTAHLTELLGGKTATLEMTLDWWRPWTEFKGMSFQLRPAVYTFRVGGVRFGMELWVYLVAGSDGDLQKIKKGDKFKVSGKFDNVMVTASAGPRLHINLTDASIVGK